MIRLFVILLGMVGLLIGSMMLSGGATRKPAEFPFVNRGDVFTLDINHMSQLQDFRIMYATREGLYANAPVTYEAIPAALGYDLSPDKKVWTFHLRPECRWTNGDPVTADDYVFSWRRMLEEPGDYTYLFHYLQNAEDYENSYSRGDPIDFKTIGMEAIDPLTFRIRLVSPVPFLLDLAAFPPFFPRHERSMAKFRIFSESSDDNNDVMDVFARYVDAAHKVDDSGSPGDVAIRFAALVNAHGMQADAVQNWLHVARNFEIAQKNQSELLDALTLFATMDPLQGMAPTKNETMINTDAESGEDTLSPLSPADKLKRMLAKHFVRYTYNRQYTMPPDVVTNGPFTLNRWEYKKRLLMVKSDNYWDKANVRINSLEMVVVENKESQMLAYKSGAVLWDSDVDDETGDQLKKSKADYRHDLHTAPAFGTYFMSLMCGDKLPSSMGSGKNPLADIRVRQALAMAIDKQEIIDEVETMGELPARSYFPPDGTLPKFLFVPGPYDADASQRYSFEQVQQMLKSSLSGRGPGLPYNIQRARELLAEAGYPGGQGFPKLPVMYRSTSEESKYICQILQTQWKTALNIDVDLNSEEAKIYRDSMDKKDFCIGPSSWYGDYPDVSTFTDKYLSTSLNNESGWKNAKFDKLCDQARYELDPAKRLEILAQAENLIDTEVPVIPIYHFVNFSMYRPWVHGAEPNPRGINMPKNFWLDAEHRP